MTDVAGSTGAAGAAGSAEVDGGAAAGLTDETLAAWPHEYAPGIGRVLLMLHGTGGNEQEILALADSIDPTAGVLAPRGRVTEGGMNRWFRRFAEGSFDVDDVIARAAELASFVTWARGHYGIEDVPITAVGFSNGANIALAVAQLHPDVLSAVVAFSGMYPFADRVVEGDLSRSHLLVSNGETDAMAPLPSVERLVAELTRKGADVTVTRREGTHGIHPAELAAAVTWLAARP